MSKTGDDVARDCLAAIQRTVEFCELCPDERWNAITSDERWPVAAVIRHIADAGHVLTGYAHEMAAGRDVTMTMAEIDAWNAAHLEEWSRTTRAQAIGRLQQAGAAAAQAVRSYTEDQLASEHMFAIYGQPRSTKRMAEGFALHALEHLESARAAAL